MRDLPVRIIYLCSNCGEKLTTRRDIKVRCMKCGTFMDPMDTEED